MDDPAEYFLQHRTTHSWMLDKSDNKEIISVAANGFAMATWAILSINNSISHDEALTWCKECFHETLKHNKQNHGWLHHFMDLNGNPLLNKEVSSIDTAIFYLGAREAARILRDETFTHEIETAILTIDTKLMLTNNGKYPNKKYFSQGFVWVNNSISFLKYDWQEYSEGVILYRLFSIPYDHPPIRYNLCLFVYYYPLCFYYDNNELQANLGAAIDYQTSHFNQVGYTACIGRNGYSKMEKGIISPLAISCCEFFFPEKVKNTLNHLPGRTIPSYDITLHKSILTRIAIDDGAYLLLKYKHHHRTPPAVTISR